MPVKVGQMDLFAGGDDEKPVLLPADRPPDTTLAAFAGEPQRRLWPERATDTLAYGIDPLLEEGLHFRQDQEMPRGWRLLGLGLAASIVQRALGAMAGIAIVIGALGWLRWLDFPTLEAMAPDHKAIFEGAVGV